MEELYIELPGAENPASTVCNIRNHWTPVSTLLDLINSVYRDLSPTLEIKPATTECRAETLLLNHLSTPHPIGVKLTNHSKCATT